MRLSEVYLQQYLTENRFSLLLTVTCSRISIIPMIINTILPERVTSPHYVFSKIQSNRIIVQIVKATILGSVGDLDLIVEYLVLRNGRLRKLEIHI